MGKEALAKAFDLNKDQSYFLAQISKKAIEHSIFPLGDITKPEVRKIGRELDLSIKDKKDSTGICFIGERNFREFLKNYIPMKEGNIIDIDTKEVIGRHQGVYYYTVGQRKGFAVGGDRGPYFCVGKDVVKNELYVASIKDEHWLYSDSCVITGLNIIAELTSDSFDCTCKFRYRQEDQKVHVHIIDKDKAYLTYDHIKAVTLGQQAVLYQGDILLGGGVIDHVYQDGQDKDAKLKKWLEDGRG